MRKQVGLVMVCLTCLMACKDEKGAAKAAADPNSKLLGERLIAQHGEGIVASPVVVAYDTGFVVGRESLDPEFGAKIEALGVAPAARLSLGQPPVHVTEYFSDQDVEFAVSAANKVVVADAGATLTVRLLLGDEAIRAVQQCALYRVDRVCKGEEQIRARLDDIPASAATLIDRGIVVSKATIKNGWAVFDPTDVELSDDVELELTMSDSTSCNYSKWVIDPRDTCVL